MKKAIEATNQEFESSSTRTPQYLAWHKLFKREFVKFLTQKGMMEVQINKPNHFDMSGFFLAKNGQLWYFSISDLRCSKDSMLIRTAKHPKDYTGGSNRSATLLTAQAFEREFDIIVMR